MFDRHLVTDLAIAAVIVLPAALPPTATPRSPDTQLVSASSPARAFAQNDGDYWRGARAVEDRS